MQNNIRSRLSKKKLKNSTQKTKKLLFMKTQKTKIMLVEDSQNLRSVLKDYFEMMNYEVIDFADGLQAVKEYRVGMSDICLLDIGLPLKDGYEVIGELRKISPNLPIIFLTARDSKEDRIKGFKLGCDDYVTKPFSTEELMLRIEAVLRRCNKSQSTVFQYKEAIYNIGDFVFNYTAQELQYGENIRVLTRKEAELLRILFEYKNKLLPREILQREIWGESEAALGRSMDVFLTKIRKYLSIDGADTTENLNPAGKRKNKYLPGREPKVELINIHGTGYLLKVRE